MRCVNSPVRIALIYVIAVVSWANVPALALRWDITEIDTFSNCAYCSIDVDSYNHPHISYIDFNEDDLMYAYFDGVDWLIDTVDYEGYAGLYSSIAVDPNDRPHIVYTSGVDFNEDRKVKYAFWDGVEWVRITVDDRPDASRTSIALDDFDNPHISYYNWGSNKLIYANKTSGSWAIEDLRSCRDDCLSTSIAIDNSGYPIIVYSSFEVINPLWGLVYVTIAEYDPPTWDYYDIYNEFSTWPAILASIDVGAEGDVGVSFIDNELYKLFYYDGSDYGIVDDTLAHGGGMTDVKFDSNEKPHISYFDGDDSLKYAYYNGSAWEIEFVEIGGPSGYYNGIGIDSSNDVHIAYAGANGVLKYAHGFENTPPSSFNLTQPPDGGEVPEPVTLDWEDSTDGDGDTITYDVWYATDPGFDPHDEVTELTDSTYTFPEGTLRDGTTYYWKVRATDGWDETWSGPDPYWSFTVEDEVTDIPVTGFTAESARDGVELTWECADPGVGFNLYRSAEATGARTKLREIINAKLITGESPYNYLDAAVENGVTYAYWLEAIDVGGSSETFGPATCTAGTFVPAAYALYQSRPNPARGTAVIAFDLPEDADVTLTIYDLSGRKVTTLVNETLPAGAHERPVAGLAPGVYVYRLKAGEFAGVRKMVVVE